ncbi:Protein XRP2 [Aphelenchoides bicaudatus]|nr:Protein XRP2 [Aphelenchoides bicaudatus]
MPLLIISRIQMSPCTVANPPHAPPIGSPPDTASTRTDPLPDSPVASSSTATVSNFSNSAVFKAQAESTKAAISKLDPVYTFEEFLKCSEDEEEIELRGVYKKRRAKRQQPQLQRFSHNFYDNFAISLRDEEATSSHNGGTSSLAHFTNQPGGQESVGFYVINERKQRPNYNPNGRCWSDTIRSTGETSSGVTRGGDAPRVLSASNLSNDQFQLENKTTNEPADTLHPLLRRTFCSIFEDLFCRCLLTPRTRRERYDSNGDLSQVGNKMCAKCFCCFRSPSNTHNRADQYRMADAVDPVVHQEQPQSFSWEKNRPSPRHYRFADSEDTVLVKRNGSIDGQQFVIDNCQNCVILVLDYLGSVTIDDCKSCIIVLGPCSGSVFVRDCQDCTIYSACQQFRTRDCSLMVHLFCATRPIIEVTTAQFFPLHLTYPFIEENLNKSGLSPFTNLWYKVHNFTPDDGAFTVSEQDKPIGQTYGPTHDWLPDLSQERVSIDPQDSYFKKTPILKKLSDDEERVLVIFNRQPAEGNIKEIPLLQFYSNIMSVIQRICANDEVVRLILTHDLDMKAGELANLLGKKNTLSGKIVSVELAGPNDKCRQHVRSFLEPLKYSGIGIQLLTPELTDSYKRNLDRLADVKLTV